jgi:hypothetical protein
MIITILLLVVLSTLLVLSIATGFKKNFGSLFSVFASLGKWMKGNPGWTIFIVVISVAGFSGYKVFEYFSMKEESNKVSVASKKNIVRSEVKAEVIQPKPGESSERYFVLDPALDEDPSPYRALFSRNLPQLKEGEKITIEEGSLSSVCIFINGKKVWQQDTVTPKGREIFVPKNGSEILLANSSEPIKMTPIRIRIK